MSELYDVQFTRSKCTIDEFLGLTSEEVVQQYHDSEIDDLLKDVKEEDILNLIDDNETKYILDVIDQQEKEPFNEKCEFQSLLQAAEYDLQPLREVKLPKLYTDYITKEQIKLKAIHATKNQLIVGTSRAAINIFSDKIVKLQSDNSVQQCPVISVRQCDDYIVAMTSVQFLIYYHQKLQKVELHKHETPLSMDLTGSQFMTSNAKGLVIMHKFKKSVLSFALENKTLLNGAQGVTHQIQYEQRDNMLLAALANKKSVFVITIEPTVEIIFKKQYVPTNTLTCVAWMGGNLIIGNGTCIDIISMESKSSSRKLDTSFIAVKQVQLPQNYGIEGIVTISGLIFCKLQFKRFCLVDKSLVHEGQFVETWQLHFDQGATVHNALASNASELFTIDEQRIVQFHLEDWESYTNALIASPQWNACLKLSIEVYTGREKRLANIPEKEILRGKLNLIIMQYCQAVVRSNRVENVVKNAIEFLIKIESFEYLFRNLWNFFKKTNEQAFLDGLEPFILKNEIKWVENLKDIMIHYKRKRKITTLKQLIINLDVAELDPIQIQQLCIEFNLFTPLIYVSPRVDNDYKTPLFKIFAIYTQLLREENKEFTESYFSDLQVILPPDKEGRAQAIRMQGYKILWYMHMCFVGELFPSQKIDPSQHSKIVSEMLLWILQEETLRVLFALDTYVLLYELRHLIDLDQDLLITDIRNARLSAEETLSMALLDITQKLLTKEQLQVYTCQMMQQKQKIQIKYYVQCLKGIFDSPSKSLHELTTGRRDKHSLSQEDLLISYMHYYPMRDAKLEDILNETNKYKFPRITAEIYLNLGEYQQSVYTMLACAENIRVFDIIERIIGITQDRKGFLDFLLLIITSLVQIDADLLTKMLYHYDEAHFQIAIQQLNSHPALKLKLLGQVVEDKRKRNSEMDQKLMVTYFQLLCEINPTSVYAQLQFNDFPLEECKPICQKHKILDAVAYLEEVSGNWMDAISYYFEFIYQQIGKHSSDLCDWLLSAVHPILQICRKGGFEEEAVQLWFEVLSRMTKLRQRHQGQFAFRQINEVFTIIIAEVLERVPLSQIIVNLPLICKCFYVIEDMKQTFIALLQSTQFELKSQRTLKVMMNKDVDSKIEQFICSQNGVQFPNQCVTCFEQIDQPLVGFLRCAHTYHIGCVQRLNYGLLTFAICEQCNSPQQRIIQSFSIAEDIYYKKKQLRHLQVSQSFQDQAIKQMKVEPKMLSEQRYEKINRWKLLEIQKEETLREVDALSQVY